jgi:hypothetical protein
MNYADTEGLAGYRRWYHLAGRFPYCIADKATRETGRSYDRGLGKDDACGGIFGSAHLWGAAESRRHSHGIGAPFVERRVSLWRDLLLFFGIYERPQVLGRFDSKLVEWPGLDGSYGTDAVWCGPLQSGYRRADTPFGRRAVERALWLFWDTAGRGLYETSCRILAGSANQCNFVMSNYRSIFAQAWAES